jgi:acetoin utilization deacetylase AcuC-like enzyme
MTEDSLIPLLYSARHLRHAPRVEFSHGRLLPYSEVPRRAEVIREHLMDTGWFRLEEPAETLPREALLAVHDADMLNHLESVCGQVELVQGSGGSLYHDVESDPYIYPSVFPSRASMTRLKDATHAKHGYYFFDPDAPVGRHTWDAALHSATLAYDGANQLLGGRQFVYALCRPPGHHAGHDFMGGFCYINNAAVGAAHLKQAGRVAILDVDYHHGNGTQDIFWDNPDVLFCSLHGDPRIEYPYYSGYLEEVGGSTDTNINIPLPEGTTSEEYLAAFNGILQKVSDFQPQHLVLSLGFDTFEEDPLSLFKVRRETYRTIGKALREMNLPVLVVQEGGYQVAVLGELAEEFFRGLLNLP